MTPPLRVTAVGASAQLGGTERVLLDFAARAFEHDIALRVLTPRSGPLIEILNQIGVPADVVAASPVMLRGSQQPGMIGSLVPAALALPGWAKDLAAHRFWRDADVIYSVGFKSHAAALLHRHKPVVWHLHEFPPAVTGSFWKLMARRAPAAVIANSDAVAEAWGGSPDRLTVVPNGVDLDRFKPRERTGWIHRHLGVPADHRMIGMPAVFARWKGHELVLKAFDAISASFPGVHLVFVGGSIYDTVAEREFGAWLEQQVRGLSRVHILPFQAKIELVYPEFDLIVHYSLRPEPFGRVVLESMACGVPVVAAAEGGPLEILGPGAGRRESGAEAPAGDDTPEGWLAVPREPGALAGTLRRALGVPREVLVAKGNAGRSRADERFSAREFARGVSAVLRKTVSERVAS